MPKKTKKFDISRLRDMSVDDAEDFWRQYRRLVRKKEIEPIRNEALARAMFSAMIRDAMDWNQFIAIADQLRRDKDLLESDIWLLFEFERFPQGWNLTSWDTHFSSWKKEERKGEDWKGTICTLIEEEAIQKNRVLEGCFRSLTRPFTDYESKWYVGLLELMIKRGIVTVEEEAEDARFLGLLDNPNASPRGLGLKVLEQLIKEKLIADKDVLHYIPAIFLEPVKGKAKKAITLLNGIAKTNDKMWPEVCRMAVNGLRHEAAEIQQTALDLLLKYDGFTDLEVGKSVQNLMPSLPASVQRSIPGQKEPPKKQTPSRSVSAPMLPEVRYETIEPVKTFDELFDLAVRLVEKAGNAGDIERLLDGLARIGSDKPSDFEEKAKPLLQRIQKKIAWDATCWDKNKKEIPYWFNPFPFTGHDLRSDIFHLMIAWITDSLPIIETSDVPVEILHEEIRWLDGTLFCYKELPLSLSFADKSWFTVECPKSTSPIKMLFSKRAESIATLLTEGKSCPLLSAPTHRHGWIDPVAFVQRLLEAHSAKTEHAEHDQVLALLRLMPHGRQEALKMLNDADIKRNEYCDAVRYALGADQVEIGVTAHYWIASARCRSPFESDPTVESKHPKCGPDGGSGAAYKLQLVKRPVFNTGWFETGIAAMCEPPLPEKLDDISLFPSVGFHTIVEWFFEEAEGYFPWMLSVWPQNLDPGIAVSLRSHSENRDKNYDYGFRHALAALARPETEIRFVGIAALFTALAMKCSVVNATATDTLITIIGDGRLTSEAAVAPVRELLGLKVLTTSRWVPHLKTISEQSDHHADFVLEFLEGMVDLLPPKDVGAFLDLLYDIAVSRNPPVN